MVLMLAPAAAGANPDLRGAGELWSKPETRFVLLGEVHGTA